MYNVNKNKMGKLNFNGMKMVNAGGCGWLKRVSRRVQRGGDNGSALLFAKEWAICKQQ